jgi:hypothetical protein
MSGVKLYGVNHSPWVQAVLLGLHDRGIEHSLTSIPPIDTFLHSGVMMPAASIDGGPWKLESAELLEELGFDTVSDEEMQLVRGAWRGVFHRTDSAALFWGNFAKAGDTHSTIYSSGLSNVTAASMCHR